MKRNRRKIVSVILALMLVAGTTGGSIATQQVSAAQTPNRNGVCQAADGNWYYYQGGEIQYVDTVAENTAGWWKITNGKVDFGYTGLACNSAGWWYIENGQVNFNYTGFGQYGNSWWYCRNGHLSFDETNVLDGIVGGQYGWWKVVGSQVIFDNDVCANFAGWWKITNGKVDFNYTGLAYNSAGWWHCSNGLVDFNYNGFSQNGATWWYCNGGHVNFDTTSVLEGTVNGENGWWKVADSQVIFDNDVCGNFAGWWKITNGKVDFAFNGLAANSGGLWVIQNGMVNFQYNGTYEYAGTTYDITGGRANNHLHQLVITSTKLPTCIEDGITEYQCYCGYSTIVTTPASSNYHQYELADRDEEKVIDKQATTKQVGILRYDRQQCNDCINFRGVEEQDARWNFLSELYFHEQYESDMCGASSVVREVIYDDVDVPEQCHYEVTGLTYVCTVCGNTTHESGSDHVHRTTDSTIKEADCNNMGIVRHTCSVCGFFWDEQTPRLGHDYIYSQELSFDGSCKKEAYNVYKCSRCGDLYKMTSTKKNLDHAKTASTESVHCTSGLTSCFRYFHCDECGYSSVYYVKDWYSKKTIKEPTETEYGIDRYTCSVCHQSIDVRTPKAGSPDSDIANNYTVTKDHNATLYTCKKCGDWYYGPEVISEDETYYNFYHSEVISIHDCEK